MTDPLTFTLASVSWLCPAQAGCSQVAPAGGSVLTQAHLGPNRLVWGGAYCHGACQQKRYVHEHQALLLALQALQPGRIPQATRAAQAHRNTHAAARHRLETHSTGRIRRVQRPKPTVYAADPGTIPQRNQTHSAANARSPSHYPIRRRLQTRTMGYRIRTTRGGPRQEEGPRFSRPRTCLANDRKIHGDASAGFSGSLRTPLSIAAPALASRRQVPVSYGSRSRWLSQNRTTLPIGAFCNQRSTPSNLTATKSQCSQSNTTQHHIPHWCTDLLNTLHLSTVWFRKTALSNRIYAVQKFPRNYVVLTCSHPPLPDRPEPVSPAACNPRPGQTLTRGAWNGEPRRPGGSGTRRDRQIAKSFAVRDLYAQ